MKYVHKDCLEQWLNYPKYGGKTNTSCTICGSNYTVKCKRPHMGVYIIKKCQNFSKDEAIEILLFVASHLAQPCDHILVCWLVKLLGFLLLLSTCVCVGRVELWMASETEWWKIDMYLLQTLDNLLIGVISLGIHTVILFSCWILYNIFRTRHDLVRRRRLWATLRGIIGLTSLILAGVFLPGYQARFLLWLFFEKEWKSLDVDFQTGKNFTLHFILGSLSILSNIGFANCIKWIQFDYSKFRTTNSRLILQLHQ